MKELYVLTKWSLFMIGLFLFGCKDGTVSTTKPELPPPPFQVSLSEASELARSYQSSSDSNANISNARAEAVNTISESRTVSDSASEEPLLYIFKRKRGFIIVAADLRVMPVLAYSDESDIDVNRIPNGVNLWLDMAKQKVKEAKKVDAPPHQIVAREWQKYLSRNLRVEDSNCIEWYQWGQFMCKPTVNQKGPLLTTSWGQYFLSNTQLSSGGNCDGCGKRFAGCGPVAMAQIDEFYHSNPARPRFPKDTCIASNAGEVSLGALMKIMGTKANAQYNYMGTCNTFTWPANVKSGLKSYGYSSGGSGNEAYNYALIKTELGGDHPVIFWGSTCLDCFENYHIWVCDGFRENYYSEFDCATKQCKSWTYTSLHMNWGWSGKWNGDYAFGQYNPDSKEYNGNLHVITGVRP